jgi:hypothetical protein
MRNGQHLQRLLLAQQVVLGSFLTLVFGTPGR